MGSRRSREASRRGLRATAAARSAWSALDLYQLHAPDPRTPLATSIRALASLKRDGLIEAIGLCNVTVGQIEEARRITEIDFDPGRAEHLARRSLSQRRRRVLCRQPPAAARLSSARRAGAASPDDAPTRRSQPSPGAHDATPVRDRAGLADGLVGSDRADSRRHARRDGAVDCPRAPHPADRRGSRAARSAVPGRAGNSASATGARHSASASPRLRPARSRSSWACPAPARARSPKPGRAGLPPPQSRRGGRLAHATAAGARCRARLGCFARRARQHLRFAEVAGRSDPGGSGPRITGSLRRGSRPASRTRRPTRRGGSCRATASCPTSRSSRRFATKRCRGVSADGVQFRYQRQLEPPDPSEGFSRVDVVPFERRLDPSFVNRAVIVCCEDVLLRSRSGLRVPLAPDDVEAMADRAAVLRRYREEGYRLLGISWQPEIADGQAVAPRALRPSCARMCDLLGVDIEVEYCPHAPGPPACWCRKPLPGLGVLFVQRHRLDPSQCIYVGSGPQDPGFARRLGFMYREASDFFA